MITGATRLAAVIGDPVRHSLSPAIYNAAFAECGLDWVFVAFDVPAGGGAAAVRAMRALGIEGLSVTMPHKTDVIEACDELSPDAAALRSVNHVRRSGDTIFGDSTDGEGFVRSLAARAVELGGRRVLLLGAGGAARAVAVAMTRAGARVTCAARRPDAAAETAALCAGAAVSIGDAAELVAVHDLVVNATSIGMDPDPGMPIPAAALRPGLVVADLVYHPLVTPLLAAAAAAGAVPIDGVGMLVHQAAIQFEAWTTSPAPVDAMLAAAHRELVARAG
jgi:shikimate dehydrogenase